MAPSGMATVLKNGTRSSVCAGSFALQARVATATTAITDCQKNFARAESPLGLRCTTLRQSSTQPMAPKPSVVARQIQT